MKLIRRLRSASIETRKIEEQLYAHALKEVEDGRRRDGLWAKALANAAGNTDRAESLYLSYVVQALKDEINDRDIKSVDQERAKTDSAGLSKGAQEPSPSPVEPGQRSTGSRIWIHLLVFIILIAIILSFI
mgnify:CR=1 FL=1